jgi:hypothetical protein
MLPSLDGRRFRSPSDVEGGDVGIETVFEYSQEGDLVHARYAGGSVRLGFLVGTREHDQLHFRYAQLRTDGTTATGRCTSRIERTRDGRLRLHETWDWESAHGSGTSLIEEIA